MSNSESSDSKSNEKEGWGLTVWIFLGLAVLFLVAGGYMAYRDWPGWSTSESWNDAGVRGDFWGGHFAAASGLAGTLILFAALLLQGHELKLQRKELQDSRRVAKQQAEALDEQTEELKLQNEQLRQQIQLTASYNESQLLLSIAEQCIRVAEAGPPDGLLQAGMRRIALLELADRERSFEMLLFFSSAVRRMRWSLNLNEQLSKAVESLGRHAEHLKAPYPTSDSDNPHAGLSWMGLAERILEDGKLP